MGQENGGSLERGESLLREDKPTLIVPLGKRLLPPRLDFNLLWVRKANASCELPPKNKAHSGRHRLSPGQGVTTPREPGGSYCPSPVGLEHWSPIPDPGRTVELPWEL